MKPIIDVEILDHGRGIELPEFKTPGSAGADIRAAVDDPITIEPGAFGRIPTGLKIAIPQGFEIQVRPRSGLAAKHQVTILNAPGTIDSDYRGEVQVLLVNLGGEPFTINRGDRIAQLVLARVEQFDWNEVAAVDITDRGEGGFGHTGVH